MRKYSIIPILICLRLIVGCSSPSVKREPSQYLLATDKSVTVLLSDLKSTLISKKYQVKKLDAGAGLLITEPRQFTYGDNRKAQQTIQIRQEGASLKVVLTYRCTGMSGQIEICTQGNADLESKIRRIEPGIVKIINSQLMKGKKDASTEAIVEEDSLGQE